MESAGIVPKRDRKCGLNFRVQITSVAFYQFYFDTISWPAKDLITKLLKVSLEESLSAEEIMKNSWLQDSQVIRMATQVRGRLVAEFQGGRVGLCVQNPTVRNWCSLFR